MDRTRILTACLAGIAVQPAPGLALLGLFWCCCTKLSTKIVEWLLNDLC